MFINKIKVQKIWTEAGQSKDRKKRHRGRVGENKREIKKDDRRNGRGNEERKDKKKWMMGRRAWKEKKSKGRIKKLQEKQRRNNEI